MTHFYVFRYHEDTWRGSEKITEDAEEIENGKFEVKLYTLL